MGETSTQTERETPQTEREPSYVEEPSDYRYTTSEPTFEDTSGYFDGLGGVDGTDSSLVDDYDTRGPSGGYGDDSYNTRG